jgi:membrane protease YdiL (CAAX protease family)
MSGQPTRAGPSPEATKRGIYARVPAVWRSFFAFLRQPVLPDRAELSLAGSARAIAPLVALDLLLMGIVLGSIGLATAMGFRLPEHMLNDLKLGPLLLAFIVVGAPLGEEALFRGWLSGRPGHILAVLALLVGGAALLLANGSFLKLAGVSLGVAIAAAALFLLRERPALPWFQRHFPWFFYGSAVLFASVHLTNFAGAGAGASPALLPLVLPQFVLALILGYLRVNRGLLTSAAMHMLHNALFAGLMLAGAS